MGKVDGVGFKDGVGGVEVWVLDFGGAESENCSGEGGVVFVIGRG